MNLKQKLALKRGLRVFAISVIGALVVAVPNAVAGSDNPLVLAAVPVVVALLAALDKYVRTELPEE